jgi:hypothetical protein
MIEKRLEDLSPEDRAAIARQQRAAIEAARAQEPLFALVGTVTAIDSVRVAARVTFAGGRELQPRHHRSLVHRSLRWWSVPEGPQQRRPA